MYFKNYTNDISLEHQGPMWIVKKKNQESTDYIYTNRIKNPCHFMINETMNGNTRGYSFGIINLDNFDDTVVLNNSGVLNIGTSTIHHFSFENSINYDGMNFFIGHKRLNLGSQYKNWGFYFRPDNTTSIFELTL